MVSHLWGTRVCQISRRVQFVGCYSSCECGPSTVIGRCLLHKLSYHVWLIWIGQLQTAALSKKHRDHFWYNGARLGTSSENNTEAGSLGRPSTVRRHPSNTCSSQMWHLLSDTTRIERYIQRVSYVGSGIRIRNAAFKYLSNQIFHRKCFSP